MSEQVNHPKHYNTGKIEVIEFIEDQGFGPGFCRGNAIKYAARAGKKDPTKAVEDLKKAVWYLEREIEILEAARDGREVVRPNDMNERSIGTAGATEFEEFPDVVFISAKDVVTAYKELMGSTATYFPVPYLRSKP